MGLTEEEMMVMEQTNGVFQTVKTTALVQMARMMEIFQKVRITILRQFEKKTALGQISMKAFGQFAKMTTFGQNAMNAVSQTAMINVRETVVGVDGDKAGGMYGSADGSRQGCVYICRQTEMRT